MSVYLIAEIQKINNPEKYAEYGRRARPIVEAYGGKYVANTTGITKLSGEWDIEKVLIIEFPQMEDLKKCFSSDEYKEVAPLRIDSTVSKAIILS